MTDILGFKTSEGTKWLSNFWPVTIEYEGVQYESTEAAFQASKHNDQDRKNLIAGMNAFNAMKEGRKGKTPDGWDDVAVRVMLEILQLKFSVCHPDLLSNLLNTGDCRIAETNTWGDSYWGENEAGIGYNVLGRLLMIVREQRNLENIVRDPATKKHHK